MDALGNLGINIGYLLMQILIMVTLYLVLRHFLYDPIMKTLEARQARIAKGLEDARQAAIARDNADAEAKKILDAARAEAAKTRQNADAQGAEQRETIVAQAHEEAKKIVADAAKEAEEERNRILSDLRSQVAAIAIAAANKLVGESLDDKRQHELIADFFAKTPASVAGLSGNMAEVTSALPLSTDEQASVKKTLGVDNVTFKVNPAILGGLVIRVDDQVVDDSVANRMSALRDTLA
jgi:F-type H+-transporting ATPase subunit b